MVIYVQSKHNRQAIQEPLAIYKAFFLIRTKHQCIVTNCNCDKLTPSCPIFTPSRRLSSFALSTIILKTSPTSTKRKGDNGSPYLKPLCILNGDDGDPLMRINIEAKETQCPIHLVHLKTNPIDSNTWSKKLHRIVSCCRLYGSPILEGQHLHSPSLAIGLLH